MTCSECTVLQTQVNVSQSSRLGALPQATFTKYKTRHTMQIKAN